MISTTYYHMKPPATPVILPPLDASGYASFHDIIGGDHIEVLNFSPGRTYTLTKAEFFCEGTDGNWRPCQAGDAWALLNTSPALPATLACGQTVDFTVQPSAQFVPMLAVFSYTESYSLNAVSSVFWYWEWPTG